MTAAAVSPLHAQLARVKEELLYARERARTVCKGLDATTWTARPSTGGWSIGECLSHLSLTSESYLPLIDEAIRDGRARSLTGAGPFGMGLVAWALQCFLEPLYDRLLVASPFDARVKYNLYAAFCLIATHQRRHLWQAEQVRLNI